MPTDNELHRAAQTGGDVATLKSLLARTDGKKLATKKGEVRTSC